MLKPNVRNELNTDEDFRCTNELDTLILQATLLVITMQGRTKRYVIRGSALYLIAFRYIYLKVCISY